MFSSSSFNGLYWQVCEDESKMKLDLELIYSFAIYHSDRGWPVGIFKSFILPISYIACNYNLGP